MIWKKTTIIRTVHLTPAGYLSLILGATGPPSWLETSSLTEPCYLVIVIKLANSLKKIEVGALL